MSRKPVSSDPGLESRAMRTSALSVCGASAASGGVSPCGGSMPQAAVATASAQMAGMRRRPSPATIPANVFVDKTMVRIFATLLLLVTPAAYAALDVGDHAPDFAAPAALAGKVYKFSLSDALKK